MDNYSEIDSLMYLDFLKVGSWYIVKADNSDHLVTSFKHKLPFSMNK